MMEDENKSEVSEDKPQIEKLSNMRIKPKQMIIALLIVIGILIILMLLPRHSNVCPGSSCSINESNSSVKAKGDLSQQLCVALLNASRQANITLTKYYYEAPFCIWEVSDYRQEYLVHCENENNTLNVMIRPYNISMEVIKSRFPECNVTRNL